MMKRLCALGSLCVVALVFALPAQAAITLVGSSTSVTGGGGGATATSLSVNVPAGIVAGDVMLAQVSVRGGSGTTISAPSGWTQIVVDNSGTALQQGLYYKVAGTEPVSYSWGFSSSQRASAGIIAYRGVDSLAPINAFSTSNAGSGTMVTAQAVTTTVSNAQIVGFYSTGTVSSFTPPAGMTELYDVKGAAGPNGVTIEAADAVQPTAGSSGSKTATAANSAENIGQLLALKPAAVLLADYHFDECSYSGVGNEVIDSTGTYNAQAVNGLNTSSPGQVQRYGNFNTYSTWTQPSTSIPLAGGDWSLSVWFRMPFISTQQYHVLASTSGNGDLLYLDRSNNYRWGVFTYGPTQDVQGNFQFGTLANGWHHLALMGQAGRSYLYIDGSLRDNVNLQTKGNVAYLGTSYDYANTTSAQGFGAPLDEMRVYTNILNPAQITAIYNNQLAGLNADGTTRAAVVCATSQPGGFNAYDTATPSGAVTGVIQTKIAGSSFNLDLIALNAAKTSILTTFTGTVKVELLDASLGGTLDSNGCNASWTTIQTLGTNPIFAASDNGRKTVAFQENNAWRNVRVRVTYPASGSPTSIGCSTDNFAIRPAGFSGVSVSDANWGAAGTARSLYNIAASGGNVHKAGQPFSINATAVNGVGNIAGNYAGTPAASVTACLLPTGCTAGALSPGSWSAASGTVISNTAIYSEAGAFTMQLVDSSFANVDANDGTPQNCTGGYVCSGMLNVGRFVPDHFSVTTNNTPQFRTFNDATCTSRSFTYIGQGFGYVTAPQALITAQNAAGATTQNYSGSLWRPTAAYAYSSPSGTLDIGLTTLPTFASNSNGTGSENVNGTDLLAYVRNLTTPQTPFNANISLNLSATDSSESAVAGNGTINTTAPAVFNGAGSGIAFDSGNVFRFGRLKLNNAFGSELLDLPIPAEAQYWNGTVFVTNTADNCTVISATNIAMGNYLPNLSACETAISISGRLSAGKSNLKLVKPGAGNNGSVDLTVNLGITATGQTCVVPLPATQQAAVAANQSYLQGKWTGTSYNQNPHARATFGVYKNANEFIYMREMY
jgi:hypothetical protein